MAKLLQQRGILLANEPDMDAPLMSAPADAAAKPGPMRFWIVLVLSCACFTQAVAWNIYGPMSDVVTEVYGWSDSTTALIENVANIAMLLAVPISAHAADRFGIRVPTVCCGVCIVLTTVLRLAPAAFGMDNKSDAVLAVMLLSMVFNGLSAAWLNFAAPMVSMVWFPVSERATATAVCSVAPFVGVAVGFAWNAEAATAGSPDVVGQLNRLYAAHAAIGLLTFLALVLRFPNRPAVAPSRSAAALAAGQGGETAAENEKQQQQHQQQQQQQQQQKQQQQQQQQPLLALDEAAGGGGASANGGSSSDSDGGGLRALFTRRARRLWFVVFVMAIPQGVFAGWGSVLDINLKPYGVSQRQAGVLGCLMSLVGCAGGVVVGRLVDRFQRALKLAVFGCYAATGAAFLWFAVVATSSSSSGSSASLRMLYASGILGGLFINAGIPLGFELATETAFPHVAPAHAAGLLCTVNTLTQIIFLSLPPGAAWSNWANACACFLCLAPFVFFSPSYQRLDMDLAPAPRDE